MPQNLKNSVAGKDIPIQNLQKFLYKKLKALWPVDESNFDGYGRVYRTVNDKGFVPEIFISSTEPNNTKYGPVAFDKDRHKAMFFFTADDNETYKEGQATVKISVIFIVNLEKIKPELPHRGDEEVRNDVKRLCSLGMHQADMIGDEAGFANVFKQFAGLVNKDGEVFEDRHPMYCFKINFELRYQPAEIKC